MHTVEKSYTWMKSISNTFKFCIVVQMRLVRSFNQIQQSVQSFTDKYFYNKIVFLQANKTKNVFP